MISVQKHWLRKRKNQLGKRVIKIQDVRHLLKVPVRREAGLCRWANGNKMWWRRSSLPESAKMWIYESWEAGSQKRSNWALFDLALETPILGIACEFRTFVQLTLLECFFFLQTESISEHPMVTQLIKFSTINVDHVLMETILPLAAARPPYYHILAQVFHTAGSLQGPRKTAQEMILLQLHICTSSIWSKWERKVIQINRSSQLGKKVRNTVHLKLSLLRVWKVEPRIGEKQQQQQQKDPKPIVLTMFSNFALTYMYFSKDTLLSNFITYITYLFNFYFCRHSLQIV